MALLTALLLMQSASALSLQSLSIGSAYSLLVSAVLLFVALSLDAFLNRGGLLGQSVDVCAGRVRASSGRHENGVYRP